ncbi:MAG: ZIP zinc transporter [Candidatus Portnoybacteria bacterium CG10_big_fil_rev_8_21_14_0_10_36_7]|uniref:ZIP zinc transporter n=1 Tax=Candidatus Portnoybacteria bacterium CG10_big_fil_rev_8_21_14_0_10_36_7 TaxID=1974812 RepID=A0A2M8KER0_9BACT|nr:MAG: ZIP zinc transporter [Candidatus Portnoybacteria bacterium CG10_big_fil_rev_8_21_14_0_10_36_7]
MSLLGQILIFSSLGGVGALVGSGLLLWNEKLTRRFSIYLISFATGIILSVAFLDLLPESVSNMSLGNPFLFVLIGICAFFILEKSMVWYHCHGENECELHTSGPMSLIGDALHNFGDGIIIAIAFLANSITGVYVALAIVLHEIPQEISDFSILLHNGMDKKRALIYNLMVAFTAPLGALVTYYYADFFRANLGATLALAAGGLMYIAIADLIPQLHKITSSLKSIIQVVLFMAGIIAGYYLVMLE